MSIDLSSRLSPSTVDDHLLAAPLPDDHPVQLALEDMGLGRLSHEGLDARAGRNPNWVGTTTSGRRVFVKLIRGLGAGDRIRREAAMHALLERVGPERRIATTHLLGVDATRGVFVFDALEGVTTMVRHLIDWDAQPVTYEALGRAVAAVHALPVREATAAGIREEPFGEPNRQFAVAIPEQAYAMLSYGMLDFYRLVQRDVALREPIDLIHAGGRDRAVIHGDLRGDQVVRFPDAPQQPLVLDFEDVRIGDPARDVGALVGEVLRAVIITTSTSDEEGQPLRPAAAPIERIVAAALERMADGAPLLRALRVGYGDIARWSPDFPERVLRVAGWHLFDRALATAQHSVAISVRDKAGAGIGRRLLLEPSRFAAALGWA
jgi:hypothetical protein